MNTIICEEAKIFIGEAGEIRRVWKSMFRAWNRNRSKIHPAHLQFPLMIYGRVYGIRIVREGKHSVFDVHNADTIVRLMFD